MLPVGGAVLVIFARDGWVNRLLSLRPVVFVGLISYSWYLWHWPLLSFALITSGTKLPKTVGAMIAITSFGCAVLSYQFIERPFRRSTIPIPSLFRRYALAASIMLAIPISFLILRGLPQRYPREARMEAGLGGYFTGNPCLAGDAVRAPSVMPACVPPGGGLAISLIGDSHAGAIAPSFRQIAARNHLRFIEMDKEDCPPLKGVTHVAPYAPKLAKDCAIFNNKRFDYIAMHAEIRAVILSAFGAKPLRHWQRGERYVANGRDGQRMSEAESWQQLEQGLNATVALLQAEGKDVYLLQDSPNFSFDPLQRTRTQTIGPRRIMAQLIESPVVKDAEGRSPPEILPADAQARAAALSAAARNPGVVVFDLTRSLCSGDNCEYEKDGAILFVDNGHLDKRSADLALQGFELQPFSQQSPARSHNSASSQ